MCKHMDQPGRTAVLCSCSSKLLLPVQQTCFNLPAQFWAHSLTAVANSLLCFTETSCCCHWFNQDGEHKVAPKPTTLVGDLAEHVGGITESGLRWGHTGCQGSSASQHADGCTAGLQEQSQGRFSS